MGFGRGPFGRSFFGRSAWARAVLFDSLPAIYRQYDEENGNALETFTESLESSFEIARQRVEAWSDLRDPLKVRSTSDTVRSIRLGLVKEPESKTEQSGADGLVTANRVFQSPTARFRAEDRGKTLAIQGSSILANIQSYKIASVVSSTSVSCDPPLITDAGPLRWQLKALPAIADNEIALEVRGGDVSDITPGWILFDGQTRFPVTRRQQFFPIDGQASKLTEREGTAGQVLADGRFQAEVAFTQKDVGKPITISGSTLPSNNEKLEIREVDASDPRIVKLWEPLTLAGTNANGGVVYSPRPGSGFVQITHEVTGVSKPLSVTVIDSYIIVSLATSTNGTATSTAAQVVAAIQANTDANALVTVAVTGTGLGIAGTSDFAEILGASLALDAGPLTWAVLPFPEIRIEGTVPPAGIILRENVDLSVSGTQAVSLTGNFSSLDIGNYLVISGSALGSNGVYPITAVTSSSICSIGTSLPAESNLAWAIRTPSVQANTLDVQVSAPSLLGDLASDFALTVDEREREDRQRSWVYNSTQWLDLKGSEKAYQLIGSISGFDATPEGLFRITRGALDNIPTQNRVIIGENTTTRFGSDGRIYTDGTSIFFASASGIFSKKDIGLCLYLRNTNNTSNEGYSEILDFVDANTVILDPTFGITAPDNGISGTTTAPSISWRLCRLYSTRAPNRPRFDDLNVEQMQTIVGADAFRMDHYGWDPGFVSSFSISVTDITPSTASVVPIYFTVEVTGALQSTGAYSTASVINNPAAWKLTDATGQDFFIETVPIVTSAGPPEICTFQVFSGDVPAAGAATLTYLGDDSTTCDFCRSYFCVVNLSPAGIRGASTTQLNDALDIVNTRLQNEVRPEHVTLVPVYKDGSTIIGSSLNPKYVLLDYALAGSISDAVSVTDQLAVIKNDTNLVDTTDSISVEDDYSYLIQKLFSPSPSDAIAVTDTVTGTRIGIVTPSVSDTMDMADDITIALTVPAPSITSLNYSLVDVDGNQSVTITGTNLYLPSHGGATVTIGGTSCTITGSPSLTSVTITTPAKTAASYTLTVTTAGGSSNRSIEFWNPLQLPGIETWLDSRTSVATSGGLGTNVTSWTDRVSGTVYYPTYGNQGIPTNSSLASVNIKLTGSEFGSAPGVRLSGNYFLAGTRRAFGKALSGSINWRYMLAVAKWSSTASQSMYDQTISGTTYHEKAKLPVMFLGDVGNNNTAASPWQGTNGFPDGTGCFGANAGYVATTGEPKDILSQYEEDQGTTLLNNSQPRLCGVGKSDSFTSGGTFYNDGSLSGLVAQGMILRPNSFSTRSDYFNAIGGSLSTMYPDPVAAGAVSGVAASGNSSLVTMGMLITVAQEVTGTNLNKLHAWAQITLGAQ